MINEINNIDNEEYISGLKVGDYAYNREKRTQVEKPLKIVGFQKSVSGINFVLLDSGNKIYSEPEILCDKFENDENKNEN